MPKITRIVEVANDDEDDDDAIHLPDGFDDEDDDDATGAGPGDDLEGLRAVARLARLVGSLPWFSAVGRPLAPQQIADAEAYIAGVGFPEARIAGIEDWLGASGMAQAPDWSDDWWQAEEQMRKALLDEALLSNAEHDLMVALDHVASRAGETAHAAAAKAAQRQGVSDPALIKVAAGAAAQAAYQAALVLAAQTETMAGDAEHPFVVKFRLFEAGRLPLGIVGGTFSLF